MSLFPCHGSSLVMRVGSVATTERRSSNRFPQWRSLQLLKWTRCMLVVVSAVDIVVHCISSLGLDCKGKVLLSYPEVSERGHVVQTIRTDSITCGCISELHTRSQCCDHTLLFWPQQGHNLRCPPASLTKVGTLWLFPFSSKYNSSWMHHTVKCFTQFRRSQWC